jgi:hypothetical protein
LFLGKTDLETVQMVQRSIVPPITRIRPDVPPELEPGSILVKTTVATICASDVHIWQGEVGFLEIAPCRGRTEWTPTIQGYIDTINAWIDTQRNKARVNLLLSVNTTGTFGGGHAGNANGTGPGYFGGAAGGGVQNGGGTQTYDELHYTTSGAGAGQTPIQNTGAQRGADAVGDLTFLMFPLGDYPGGGSTSSSRGGGNVGVDDSQSSAEDATIFLGIDENGRDILYVEEPPRPKELEEAIERVRQRFASKLLW